MSSFEVYYVVQKDKEEEKGKIVAGPYYEYLEAFSASSKLEKVCQYGWSEDKNRYSFEVMTHILELIDGVID